MPPPETAREYHVSKSITSHHFLSYSLYAQRDYVLDNMHHVDTQPAPEGLKPIFTLSDSLNESAYVCKAPRLTRNIDSRSARSHTTHRPLSVIAPQLRAVVDMRANNGRWTSLPFLDW